MKTQGWYKVIKDEEYFKEFLGIFSEFHDYRITHIEYDFEKNHLMLYLRYDTDEECKMSGNGSHHLYRKEQVGFTIMVENLPFFHPNCNFSNENKFSYLF